MTICGASENCRLVVDVVLQSSDGKQLGAHSKNLELLSDAFPTAGSTLPPAGDHDVVELSETAQVLQLLLQFTYNLPPPDLSSLELDALLGLAEAAHKYGMSYAIHSTSYETSRRVPEHPLEILAFKAKFSDQHMIDDAARRTMSMPLRQVMIALDPQSFRTWILYREEWHERFCSFKELRCALQDTVDLPRLQWISPDKPISVEKEHFLTRISKDLEPVGRVSTLSNASTTEIICMNLFDFVPRSRNFATLPNMLEMVKLVNELPQWKDMNL